MVLPVPTYLGLYFEVMNEINAADLGDDQQVGVETEQEQDHPSRFSTEDELTSLVDGIAMLGRFESELAEFELTLARRDSSGS